AAHLRIDCIAAATHTRTATPLLPSCSCGVFAITANWRLCMLPRDMPIARLRASTRRHNAKTFVAVFCVVQQLGRLWCRIGLETAGLTITVSAPLERLW